MAQVTGRGSPPGYIKLYRKSTDNPLYFAEPFTKWQAWVDLLLLANYKETTLSIRGNLVTVKRGQVLAAETFLADRWKWSRGRVRRFLSHLESKAVQQITHESNSICGVITICNYETYNNSQEPEVQQVSTQTVQQTVQQKDNRKTTDGHTKEGREGREGKEEREAVDWQEVQDHWNAIASKNGLKSMKLITAARKGKYKSRLATYPDFWQIINKAITESTFLKGSSDRGWKVDFDFCIKSDDAVTQMAEGKYANNGTPATEEKRWTSI